MNGKHRSLAWHGPDPDRVDAARVSLQEDRLSAHGTSCTPDYTLTYRLETGPGWVTRALDVRCRSREQDLRLELLRDGAGTWTAQRWADGRLTNHDLPDLGTALDCDLGLCPLTNTMPVLRTGLLQRPEAKAQLLMAWVSVPDLQVRASRQEYGPATLMDGAGAAIRFAADDDVATAIDVDGDGLVVSYPGIGTRLLG